MRVRIRARNRRGAIRTDFGARWLTAPLENFIAAETDRAFADMLIHGIGTVPRLKVSWLASESAGSMKIEGSNDGERWWQLDGVAT